MPPLARDSMVEILSCMPVASSKPVRSSGIQYDMLLVRSMHTAALISSKLLRMAGRSDAISRPPMPPPVEFTGQALVMTEVAFDRVA